WVLLPGTKNILPSRFFFDKGQVLNVPALPKRCIRPARLRAVVEISTFHVGLPQALLLLGVLPDERIAATQFSGVLRVIDQGVMNHVAGVAARSERFIDALR